MTIYSLKKSFQNLLRPLSNALACRGVTPNQVTIGAFLLSCGCGGTVFLSEGSSGSLFLVPVVMFVRMALNAIDGMLAHEHNMKTASGAMLNELGDVLSDTVLYLPFAVVSSVPAVPIVIIVVLSVIAEMTGVVAMQIGASRRYDGPMGKSDRAFVFGLLALLLGLSAPIDGCLPTALWLTVILLLLTVVNRARNALDEVRSKGRTIIER